MLRSRIVRFRVPYRQLQAQNDASVDAVMEVIASDGWEHVTEKFGITVVRKFMSAPASDSESIPEAASVVNPQKAAKFACVKAVGTLDADAFELYKLFLDNERVHVRALLSRPAEANHGLGACIIKDNSACLTTGGGGGSFKTEVRPETCPHSLFIYCIVCYIPPGVQ